MNNIWLGNIELAVSVFILSLVLVAVLLPTQLLLCFKVKNMAVRLLPAILLLITTIVLVVLTVAATGWDRLAYIIFVCFAMFLLFICGIGWGMWAIIRRAK